MKETYALFTIFSLVDQEVLHQHFFLDSELFVGITYTLLAYKFIKDAYAMPHLMNKGGESFKIDLVVYVQTKS